MDDFLSGRRRNPDNATYSKLDKIDFDARSQKYEDLLEEVKSHPDIPLKHHHIYEKFIGRSQKILDLMHQASLFRNAEVEEDRDLAKSRFQELNESLYGKPDHDIARGMVQEILQDTECIPDSKIQEIRDSFIKLLPKKLSTPGTWTPPAREPSLEARECISRAVEFIYRPLLTHTERLLDAQATEEGVEKEDLKVYPQGIAVIFQEIIDQEFPDSGWKVKIVNASAILINVVDKEIGVPQKRIPATPDKVRGLVVHELGVHMLRSIIGERSNLIPLQYGLSGGNEAEEGIAKVMESALTDDAARTGYQHYLTATLLGAGKDFRDTHEIMWRYTVLDSYLNKPEKINEEDFIDESKKKASDYMFRSIRGTNELPWHLTLGYFRGTPRMWDYVEKHAGDPDFIAIMFMGRIDPTSPDHLKSAFDAMSRV